MTDRENIRNIIELFIAWNGETEVIDIANLDSAVDFIADSLQEEPVSEDLEEDAENAIEDLEQKLTNVTLDEVVRNWLRCIFRAGALWQKEKTIRKACKWIKEINNHHYIMRYSDSCEPTANELIEWFKNYMEE